MDDEKKYVVTERELQVLVHRMAREFRSPRFLLSPHFNEDNIVEIAKSQFPRLEAEVAMNEDKERTRLEMLKAKQQTALAHRQEMERTRRLLIVVAGICLLGAGSLIVFAPSGKEGVSYAVAAVLAVLALGAIGIQEFRIRTLGMSIEGATRSPERGPLTERRL